MVFAIVGAGDGRSPGTAHAYRHTVAAVITHAARHRFAAARVARLATVTPAGDPHLVPIVFVLLGDVVWSAVDRKPKSTSRLRRLENVTAHPRVSLLVDHYEDNWSTLWWVRADGVATIETLDAAREALTALAGKYPQYRAEPPPGPVIRVDVDTWAEWAAE
jgi:PPOX class probable F420-dependent enzyme